MIMVFSCNMHHLPKPAGYEQSNCSLNYLEVNFDHSANLPTGLYILPSIISSLFLLWAKLSQYLLDRFSVFFHQIEGICVNFLDPVQFFQFFKGRCHGNQFCGTIAYPPCTYRYLNECINSANDASILCENLVKFGPVVFELKWGRK